MWKYFSKQVSLNPLPDWVTFVGNALYHSLKGKSFQNIGQDGKQNWNILSAENVRVVEISVSK
jgi:hypothetical protein